MRLLALIAISTALGFPPGARAQTDPCQAGVAAHAEKNFPAAVLLLNQCLSGELTARGRVNLLRTRAQAYQRQKEFDLAIGDVNAAIALDTSRNAWPWIELAMYRRDKKQYDESLAALAEAEKRDEDGPGTGPGMAVNYHRGWTLHEAGRYAEAVKAYTKGLPHQPDYAFAYYRRALAHEALGDRAKAKKDLTRAAKLSPKVWDEPDHAAKLREYGLRPKTRKK